jgi:hypothetical protein
VIPDYCPECGHERFVTSRFRTQGTIIEKTNCARCGLLVAADEPVPVRRSLLDDLGLGALREWFRPSRPSAPAGPGSSGGDDHDDHAEEEGPAPRPEAAIPDPHAAAAGDWLGELAMDGRSPTGEVLSPTPVAPVTEAMRPADPSVSDPPWSASAEAAREVAPGVVGETVVTEMVAEIDGAAETAARTAPGPARLSGADEVPAGDDSSRAEPLPRDTPDPD